MADTVSVKVIVHGFVQGVSFRYFVVNKARELGIVGFVRNLPSGVDLEVKAEGNREKLENLIEHLKKGPSGSKIEKVEIVWSESSGKYSQFVIQY